MAAIDICRICLCKALQMHSVSVFYKISSDKTVSEVITHMAPVEVSEEDPLPKFICINCYQVILLIENFIQQIVTSDYQLKQTNFLCQGLVKNEKSTEKTDPIKIKDEKEQEVPVKIEVEIDIKEEIYFDEIKNEISNESLTYSSDYVSDINTPDESKNTELINQNKPGRKSFTCQLCSKELLELSRFKDHMISHSEDKPFICEYCFNRFKRRKSLNEHLRKFHSKSFENTKKETTLPPGEDNNSHIAPTVSIKNIKQEFTEEDPSQNQGTNPELSQGSTLNDIENTEFTEDEDLEENIFDCNLCAKKMGCKSHIINKKTTIKAVEASKITFEGNHYPQVATIPIDRLIYKCEFCLEPFNSEDSLGEHRKNHTEEKTVKCRFCKIMFQTPKELKLHKAIHLDKNSKKHTCPQCDKLFVKKILLYNHMERGHPEKNLFVCQICQKTFQSWKTLRSHKRITHNPKKCKK